jgi:adenosylcobinamide-GDP ribazoletransferase
VGLIIGSLLFIIYLIFNSYFSPEITSAFILGGWVYLTGALHLDGLADTIDGLSGGKDKEEILSIMKDTRIGAKGVAAVVVLMLIKFFLIIQVISSPCLQVLIYTPILSRWGMVTGCYAIPYTKEEGMGKFSFFLGYPQIIGATLITAVWGIFLLGAFFLVPLIAAGGFSLVWSFYLKRKIGGFTGDTLGALNEMGEVVGLLFASLPVYL